MTHQAPSGLKPERAQTLPQPNQSNAQTTPMAKTSKREETAIKPQPKLKVVKGGETEKEVPAAEKMMAAQLEGQLKKKAASKPSEATQAAAAMQYEDKALAYADFARKIRHSEQVEGGLVAAALEYAIVEAAKSAGEAVDPVNPDALMSFMEQVSEGSHPFGTLYVATSKAMREIQERVQGTPRPAKLTARLGLILGAAALPVAEKLAQSALKAAELHYYAEWGKSKLTSVDAKRDYKALGSLADFLNSKGRDIKASQVRSEAEQFIQTEAVRTVDVTKPPEMDLSKLSVSEAKLVNMVKNAGGSVTTEVIKRGFSDGSWSIKDMSRLMDQKVLSTPREGVVRLDESKLMPPAIPPPDKNFGAGLQGPPRKSHAIKTPKEPRKHEWQLTTEGQQVCSFCAKPDIDAEPCPGPKKPPRASGANKPIINPEGKCLCGCGAEVKTTSRFGIGHDAKLHSAVLKAAKGDKAILAGLPLKREASAAYLRQAPWMTPEVLKAIGL